jgi:type II secretory pathway component PulC
VRNATLMKWIINLLLFCLVVFSANEAYRAWTEPLEIPLPPAKPGEMKATVPYTRTARHTGSFPQGHYEGIVTKNLFSPERQQPEDKPIDTAIEKAEKKVIPNILLYGVVITGEDRKALLTNPERGTDQRRFTWASAGEVLGGYEVVEIGAEKVFLQKDGKRYEVGLYTEKARRGQPPALKPNVVVQQTQPVKKEPVRKEPAKTGSLPPPSKLTEKKEAVEESEFEIIKTPFGEIKRRKQ